MEDQDTILERYKKHLDFEKSLAYYASGGMSEQHMTRDPSTNTNLLTFKAVENLQRIDEHFTGETPSIEEIVRKMSPEIAKRIVSNPGYESGLFAHNLMNIQEEAKKAAEAAKKAGPAEPVPFKKGTVPKWRKSGKKPTSGSVGSKFKGFTGPGRPVFATISKTIKKSITLSPHKKPRV